MGAPDDDYATAFSAALQVAVINALRGLLAAEREINPDVEAVATVLGTDGTFEVTCTDGGGRPIGGYAI